MKKKLFWTVVILLALTGLVLFVAQPQLTSLPRDYKGISLLTCKPQTSENIRRGTQEFKILTALRRM